MLNTTPHPAPATRFNTASETKTFHKQKKKKTGHKPYRDCFKHRILLTLNPLYTYIPAPIATHTTTNPSTSQPTSQNPPSNSLSQNHTQTAKPSTITPLPATAGPSYHSYSPYPKKPTIIIIPSFLHTPAHYGPLSHYLRSQNHSTFALHLPSIGPNAGTDSAGMKEDITAIRRVLEALVEKEEEDVVVVMHGYGAVPGCQAIAGLERTVRVKEGKMGGVAALVFVGGLLVEEGESIESTLRGLGEEGVPEYVEKDVSPHKSAIWKFRDSL